MGKREQRGPKQLRTKQDRRLPLYRRVRLDPSIPVCIGDTPTRQALVKAGRAFEYRWPIIHGTGLPVTDALVKTGRALTQTLHVPDVAFVQTPDSLFNGPVRSRHGLYPNDMVKITRGTPESVLQVIDRLGYSLKHLR